jgi:hypothetical protein
MALFPMCPAMAGLSAGLHPQRTKVRLVVNPCAVLLNQKIAHFQIGNLTADFLIAVWALVREKL